MKFIFTKFHTQSRSIGYMFIVKCVVWLECWQFNVNFMDILLGVLKSYKGSN